MSDKIILGIYENYEAAREAVEALRKADFSPHDISVLGPDREEVRMAAVDLESDKPDKYATTFSIWGAVGGWLIGLTSMWIPGVGPFLAAGPLLAALGGAAAGSYIGFLTGVLTHFDVPEYDAKVYEAHLSEGRILIAVHTEDRDHRLKAEDIFEQTGAIEISSRSEEKLPLPEPGSDRALHHV